MQGALQSQGRVVVVGKPRSARDPFILAPHQSLAALVAQRRATCRQLHTVARGFGVAGAVLLAASAVWGLAVLWHRRAGQGGCRLGSWVVGAVMVGGGSGWPARHARPVESFVPRTAMSMGRQWNVAVGTGCK